MSAEIEITTLGGKVFYLPVGSDVSAFEADGAKVVHPDDVAPDLPDAE